MPVKDLSMHLQLLSSSDNSTCCVAVICRWIEVAFDDAKCYILLFFGSLEEDSGVRTEWN